MQYYDILYGKLLTRSCFITCTYIQDDSQIMLIPILIKIFFRTEYTFFGFRTIFHKILVKYLVAWCGFPLNL